MRFVYESTEVKTVTTFPIPVWEILGILQISDSFRKRLPIKKWIPLVLRLNNSYIFRLTVRVVIVNVQQIRIFIPQVSGLWDVGVWVKQFLAYWFVPKVRSILSVAVKLYA